MTEEMLNGKYRWVVTIVKDLGAPLALCLIVFGWATGWIPFTVCDSYREQYIRLSEHKERDEERVLLDKRIAMVLEDLSAVVRQINSRNAIVDCARIADHSARIQCLEVVKVVR